MVSNAALVVLGLSLFYVSSIEWKGTFGHEKWAREQMWYADYSPIYDKWYTIPQALKAVSRFRSL